jgi:oxygen-dependent protoporphyrinogen oxidase
MKHVVIVGGGISGLTIAYRLQQLCPSDAIAIFEEKPRLGGTVWTERQDEFQVEIGPNGFLDNNPSTLNLCRDLGLESRLVSASEESARNRYLFLNGKLLRLPHGLMTFLTSPLLSWRGKLRLLAERFVRRSGSEVDESIDAFVRRRAGQEAAEILADALVTGIHAGDPKVLSLPASFPRLASLEREFGSVLRGIAKSRQSKSKSNKSKGPRMWSFPEGLRVLIETLRDRLKHPPKCGAKVLSLERPPDRLPTWLIRDEGKETWQADAVVLACPAYEQAAILSNVDPELAKRIDSIVYNRLAVVALGYRNTDIPTELNGFGFIAPQRTRRDILGVQWCSSIFPMRAAAGMVLLRAMCGGWNRPEIVDWDDGRVMQAVHNELQLSMGILSAPVYQKIIRWDRAIPQYRQGHLESVAWIEDRAGRLPGLFLAGNAYHGVSLNDCTEQAEKLATRICSYLGKIQED